MISKLQFITSEYSDFDHLDWTSIACESGCSWIQLRMKDRPDEEILRTAVQARSLCDAYGARLIINDNPFLALRSQADGVHLGKADMSPSEARKILGSGKIIGVTANTLDDVLVLVQEGVDYIGLGPYRFTETKKNLSPVLGLKGFALIMNACAQRGITIPVIAIGGINTLDIEPLLETGIHGIAVSSLITGAQNAKETTREVLDLLNKKVTYA